MLSQKLKQKEEDLKKKRIRQKNFKIYLDGELYKEFQDNTQRKIHYESNKFKKLSENKEVVFEDIPKRKIKSNRKYEFRQIEATSTCS